MRLPARAGKMLTTAGWYAPLGPISLQQIADRLQLRHDLRVGQFVLVGHDDELHGDEQNADLQQEGLCKALYEEGDSEADEGDQDDYH